MSESRKTIQNIELKNFKGYRQADCSDANKFNLDADLVLVTGKNGVGKTSLLEAMDWVLNQPESEAGGYLTSGEKSGIVSVNGQKFHIEGKNKVDRRKLKTIASFFYQENISELACNDIIQLLEPENNSALDIKQGLKKLQAQLEDWQREIHSLRYRKNYDEERRILAGKASQVILSLTKQSWGQKQLGSVNLILKNGNLKSKWEFQIEKLSEAIGDVGHLVLPIGAKLPQQLRHISSCLLEYRVLQHSSADLRKIEVPLGKEFWSRLQELPIDIEFKKWESGKKILISEISSIYLAPEFNIYAENIRTLEKNQQILRAEYRRLSDLLGVFSADDVSLINWIGTFKDNVDDWLSAWDGHTEKTKISLVKDDLQAQLKSLESFSGERFQELKGELKKVEEHGKEVAVKLNHAIKSQGLANEICAHPMQLSALLKKKEFSIKELMEFFENSFNEDNEHEISDTQSTNDSEIFRELSDIFIRWSELESQKIIDEKNVTDLENMEQAESLIAGALAICKQETGVRSQLLSLIGVIPKAELELLVQNMNSLLSSFHFPEKFLPIALENYGSEKVPKWGFKTHSNVNFEDLSTGQKSQLAICWTINLNLALTDQLGHNVIAFDDFTTSLDMNQMIPAAVLLRKLAYASTDAGWKRQVIVTSHHEDLTNRLLDFLLPPSGKSMKVIQFEDWSAEKGPSYKCFNVDMGDVCSEGLGAAIKHIV